MSRREILGGGGEHPLFTNTINRSCSALKLNSGISFYPVGSVKFLLRRVLTLPKEISETWKNILELQCYLFLPKLNFFAIMLIVWQENTTQSASQMGSKATVIPCCANTVLFPREEVSFGVLFRYIRALDLQEPNSSGKF